MNSKELITKVYAELTGEEYKARENKAERGFGYRQLPLRLQRVAEYCARTWPGDLAEIGLLYGDTTVILARIAKKYNKRVIGIDPFNIKGRGYENNYYKRFLENTRPWRDLIDVIKLSSMDPKARKTLMARPLCFAYIDGWHSYEVCYSDILTVGHCKGIIAVDDVRIQGKPDKYLYDALLDGATALSRTALDNELAREGYLV